MEEIERMMLGREIGEHYPRRTSKIGDVVLETEGLGLDGVYENVSFQVRVGKAVGFSGLPEVLGMRDHIVAVRECTDR